MISSIPRVLNSPLVKKSIGLGLFLAPEVNNVANNSYYFEDGLKLGEELIENMRNEELTIFKFIESFSTFGQLLEGRIEDDKGCATFNSYEEVKERIQEPLLFNRLLLKFRYNTHSAQKRIINYKNVPLHEDEYLVSLSKDNELQIVDHWSIAEIHVKKAKFNCKITSHDANIIVFVQASKSRLECSFTVNEGEEALSLIISDKITLKYDNKHFEIEFGKNNDVKIAYNQSKYSYGFGIRTFYEANEEIEEESTLQKTLVNLLSLWQVITKAIAFLEEFLLLNKIEHAYIFFSIKWLDDESPVPNVFVHLNKQDKRRAELLQDEFIKTLINSKQKDNVILRATQLL